MLKQKVFSFMKPTVASKIPSAGIARKLSDLTGAELCWDAQIAAEPLDVLFLVNGAFAFCNVLAEVGQAVRQAKRVVWVQNDYTIAPPKVESNAESPFRAAFRLRNDAGLPPMDYWTTIRINSLFGRASAYINWNALTFGPLKPGFRSYANATRPAVIYYGSYRQHREPYFDRFFDKPAVKFVVAGAAFAKFAASYPLITVEPGIPQTEFIPTLAKYRAGLYIEDPKSHKEFHSPANRFYEMLSAGLPMMFQEEAVPRLAEAGYDITPWVVSTEKDVRRFMTSFSEHGKAQFRKFGVKAALDFAAIDTDVIIAHKNLIKELRRGR